MRCQTCENKTASVHQFDVDYDADGAPTVRETHLCTVCAKAAGIPVASSPGPANIIKLLSKNLLAGEGVAAEEFGTGEEDQACPQCGWTLRDLRQTSRLGCPHDYEVFGDSVTEILERLHGESEHDVPEDQSVLDRLMSEMEEAVRQEDYETAARLRDDIQRLEEGLDAPEKGE